LIILGTLHIILLVEELTTKPLIIWGLWVISVNIYHHLSSLPEVAVKMKPPHKAMGFPHFLAAFWGNHDSPVDSRASLFYDKPLFGPSHATWTNIFFRSLLQESIKYSLFLGNPFRIEIFMRVYNANFTMVYGYGIYNELVTGAYKPTYNWGASHCRLHIFSSLMCENHGYPSLHQTRQAYE